MRIGLRVCVNSLQGALQGVPNLLRLFDAYKIRASFFFALGPDRSRRLTGAHPLQPWRRQHGLLTRLAGSLLPPTACSPKIAGILRAVHEAGHETGLLSFDAVAWIDQAAHADAAWTRGQLMQAVEAYDAVLQRPPRCHAAAGWQVNPHLLRLEDELGFDYAADVRGKSVFRPELLGIESDCPQIPTTLPSLAELLAVGGEVTPQNVHEHLYAESQYLAPQGHVYSLDAELEGLTHLSVMEKLVVMWKGYGEGLTNLSTLLEAVDRSRLQRHRIGWDETPGLACHQARQSLPL